MDDGLDLKRPATARALGELVAHERARQDARLSALRRLRSDAEAMLQPEGDVPQGIAARIAAALKKRKRRSPSEEELRARYELAQLRARRATVFAEDLAGLEKELREEIERLQQVLVDLAHDEQQLEKAINGLNAMRVDHEARAASEKDAVKQRQAELEIERTRARLDELDAQRAAVRAAEDRLLGLVENERMLCTRLAHLRREVEQAASSATRKLDEVADALRALATSSDARQVVAELESALEKLFGSLDESARLVRDHEAVREP